MPNSENIKLSGFLPLVLTSILTVGSICAAAAFFLPKSQQAPQIDFANQAQQLSEPLANTMMKQGFSQVKKLLAGISEADPNTQYYLYSMTGMSEPALIFQSDETAISPISQVKQFKVGNTLTVHQPLKLDGQYVGELIIKHQVETGSNTSNIAYGLFALAVLLAFGFALFAQRRLAKQLATDKQKLKLELKKVTEEQDYKRFIDSNLGFGFDEVAQSINDVLQQVQTSIDNNQTSEKELKQLQTSLETEVQARTLALEKATMNAERANEAKTTFLATMSHEIRTPMNGVIGTIDLLRQTDLDGAQHRLSTIIRDSAFSLLGILDDILDFSKIEAGKLQIDNTAFSVTDTIEEVARVLSSVAKKRKLDLQLAIAPDIPKNLIGDNIRVRQVLYNLCSNAIKFTTTDENRQGFVKVAVEVAQNTSEHYTLRFSVTDNGKGMTQLQLREIFNPFIQAENSITREYGGTGLGLSICKSLIELMLGSINVTSDLGMGSEFVVELPFSTDGKVEYANKAVLGQKSVVVLTDNPARKAIICRYLSFMGANTNAIDSIDEAAEFQHMPNLIWVLDGLEGMAPVNDQLRSLLYSLEQNNQQVIVLSTMDESALNHANIFYLNAAPLCKSSFMTSVMVAAGLHKPKQLKKATSLNNFLNVDKARAENKLVLLAEDNVLNQQVLTDQLHLLGYGVEVAENGEEGLAMWKKNHYPIILTDLHMPKMSGYDMVKAIRDEAEKSDDIKAQPYIIAVTANALKGEKERCIATGMNDYITKPIELNVLEATLAKWQPEKHVQMSASQDSTKEEPTLPVDNEEISDTHPSSQTQQKQDESEQFEDISDTHLDEPKTEISDENTDFDSDLNWTGETPQQAQNTIEDDIHTIDIDALTETDNAHLAWQEPETEETKSTSAHEDNYDLDLSIQSHEADDLAWQEEISSTSSTHTPSEDALDLSHFDESDSDLEWKDDSSNAKVDELEHEHEINIDKVEADSQDNLDWQNLNDIDETASISSEDKTENAVTDTLTEETEQVGFTTPSQASALTGSLSSISLESTWEATPATQSSDNTIPTPSFSLAPEGTSQDALNPASTQENATPEIKVLVEDTIEVDTSNEVKAIEPEFSEVQPEVEATTEDDLPAEESIEEPQVDISTLAVVDIDMFDKYVNHDEAKKLRFFRMYLEQSSELIRDIFANVMTREQDKIISDCHQLKSISKTVGAMQVAEIAIQFEQACKDRELTIDELISFRDKLDDYYTDAMMFMQDFIKQRSE
ncbi:Sensory box histidine kinase/response regulator [Pseudoalteromonas phenolica]|uniref:Sensory/regulatory protein RpfC n=3 Tax=Pseudoalteromonas phenolica TaxID=161398 RepID=A0A0S2JZ35_9GAMM|nr:Sensory box histidine kinase/response regulator [Pseudoalteromonas phenolica]MBE0354189.1 hypothetical protein [Pseudoalteromonas phenolica O-BC30]